MAASRLLAADRAWKSPVRWRLISSIGTTWAWPPPVAPPFWPKQGPSEGSRRQITVRRPIRFNASPRPIVVVVLPSPAGVGEMAVTRISLPRLRRQCRQGLGTHLRLEGAVAIERLGREPGDGADRLDGFQGRAARDVGVVRHDGSLGWTGPHYPIRTTVVDTRFEPSGYDAKAARCDLTRRGCGRDRLADQHPIARRRRERDHRTGDEGEREVSRRLHDVARDGRG